MPEPGVVTDHHWVLTKEVRHRGFMSGEGLTVPVWECPVCKEQRPGVRAPDPKGCTGSFLPWDEEKKEHHWVYIGDDRCRCYHCDEQAGPGLPRRVNDTCPGRPLISAMTDEEWEKHRAVHADPRLRHQWRKDSEENGWEQWECGACGMWTWTEINPPLSFDTCPGEVPDSEVDARRKELRAAAQVAAGARGSLRNSVVALRKSMPSEEAWRAFVEAVAEVAGEK